LARKMAQGEVVAAVQSAASEFARRNPGSAALFERAQKVMPGGNTRSALHFDPFPLYIAESAGAYVGDVDGHRYLDALGEFTAGIYGHSDPVIAQTVASVAACGISNGAPGVHEIALAELVCARFPSIERIRFCNSGTEANLYALSLARAATGRKKLISFSGAYHGGVFVFSGEGSAINAPYEWITCRYNDVKSFASIMERSGEVAAVIVEPMLSNGGCVPATRDFLVALRNHCDATRTLLIFDEVVTSRHGAHGAQGLLGIRPDLTTLGKYIGAGFSFGAFGGRSDIMEQMNPTKSHALPHAGTFNNNVYSMRAGAAALSQVFTEERAKQLFDSGEALRSELNALCRDLAPDTQFTGVGSTMNLHFHRGPITCTEDLSDEPKELFKLFHFDLMRAGVYIARRGQINLSLPMTETDTRKIVDTTREFLRERSSLIGASCTDGTQL
jgi:glutamate-1-semialdehyde 2,1-aminomutase